MRVRVRMRGCEGACHPLGAAQDVGSGAGKVAESLAERLQTKQFGACERGGAVYTLFHAVLLTWLSSRLGVGVGVRVTGTGTGTGKG